MKQIEEYLKNYNHGIDKINIKKLLSGTSLYFVPMLNPDGVDLSQFGLATIKDSQVKKVLLEMNNSKSDFTRWKANVNGVDLNRNFHAGWNKVPNKPPSSEKYKGPSPESEPETKAITNYIRKIHFNGLISYHATGSVIYWYNDQPDRNLLRDGKIAAKIADITNYSLIKPQRDSQEGGLKDWFIPTFKSPGLTIEVGRSTNCPLSIKEFSHIWNENKFVPLVFAEEINLNKN